MIPPKRSLPPDEFCRGRPSHAERLRPFLKTCGSGTVATSALTTSAERAIGLEQMVKHETILIDEHRQARSRRWRHALIILVADDYKQPIEPSSPMR